MLVLQGEGCALALRLTGPDGRALEGARVCVSRESTRSYPREGVAPDVNLAGPQRSEVVSDAEGRCLATGLAPGSIRVSIVARDLAPRETLLELVPGTTRALEIALDAGLTLRGTVRASDGTPLAGALLSAGGGSRFAERATLSASDGSYTLAHLTAGELPARALLGGVAPARVTLYGSVGAELEWDPVLDPGRVLRGKLLDERGLPLADWGIAAVAGPRGSGAPSTFSGTARTDEAGRFSIAGCPEEPVCLVVHEPAQRAEFPAVEFDGVAPTAHEQEFRVPEHACASASLTGTTLGSDGAPVAAELRLTAPGWRYWSTRTSARASGAFRFGLLAAGAYQLEGWSRDGTRFPPRAVALEAGQELDLGPLALGERGRLTLALARDVAPADAQALSGVWAQGLSDFRDGFDLPAGELPRELELPCGVYVLHLAGELVEQDRAVFRIEPGRTTGLELRPQRGGWVILAVLLPPGRALPLELEIVLRARGGNELQRVHRRLEVREGVTAADASQLALLVPPGDGHELDVIGPDGLHGHGVLGPVEPADVARAQRIAIELR